MREPGLVPKKEVARGFLREEEEEEDWSGAEGNCVNIWSFVAIFVGVKSLLEIDRVEDIACDFEDTHSIQFNSQPCESDSSRSFFFDVCELLFQWAG